MENEKYKTAKIAAIIVTLLMFSSTFLVFSNSTATTAKAAIASDMLQYEWPQTAVDSSRSFFSAGPGPTTPHIEWKTEIPNLFHGIPLSTIVAFNGMVFVQGCTPDFVPTPENAAFALPAQTIIYALDAATGKIIYKLVGVAGSIGKIDDTYMLIGNNCYRIADGSLVWTGPSGFSYSSSQSSGCGYTAELKMVISGSKAWSLADPSQPPTLLWNRATEADYGDHGAESLVIYGNGIIVYNTAYGYIRGVNVTTGKTMWTKITTESSWTYGSSAIDGVFGHGSLDGNFYGWNITTGELMWTFNAGTFYNMYSFASSAAYGMFYEMNEDKHLYAINATTGDLVWSYEGPGVSYQGIINIAGGKVYAQTGENQYVDFATGAPGHSEYACLDAYTGKVIWKMPFENAAELSQQANAYGNLYVVPTTTQYHIGINTYAFNTGTLNEVWCIGDTPQDWPMLLNDPAHGSFGDGPTNLALKWTATIGGRVVSSPTLANGVLYEGCYDGYIYALNADTGTQIWNYSTGKLGFSSTVAVVNGKLYTGPDDGNVYCLDASTGGKLWQSAATAGTGSPTVTGGEVYVAGGSNLYCFDANSGALIWNYSAGGAIAGAPAVADGAVYITAAVAGGGGPNLIKLNATTAAVIFNVDFPGWLGSTGVTASPTLGAGMVFVRANNRYNYAINATTGEIVWFKDARYNLGYIGQWNGAQQACAMLYKYGTVYFSDFYSLTAVNALNGSEIWSTYTSRESLAPGLSYSYGRVYEINEAGILNVFDAQTGERLSSLQFSAATMHTVPVPYNGSLYLGSLDWNIYCFDEAMVPAIVNTNMTLRLSANSVTKGGYIYIDGGVSSVGYPVNVTLTLDKPDSTYVDIPVTADANGNFMVIQTFDIVGDWNIVAFWNGDETHTAACSETLPLKVVEPEAAPAPATQTDLNQALAGLIAGLTPLLIGIIVAVAVIICLSVYTLWKVRKQNK